MSNEVGEGAAAEALAPYRSILEHAELELELAGRGEVEGLIALAGRWDQLIARAPATPPPAAASLLERATLMHERTHVELIRLREALLADIGTSRRAGRAARGYAGQLPARPRLSRSA